MSMGNMCVCEVVILCAALCPVANGCPRPPPGHARDGSWSRDVITGISSLMDDYTFLDEWCDLLCSCV